MTMTVAIEVLQWLAAQVALQFDFRPAGDITRFVPTRAKLLADPHLDATFTSYLAELQTVYRRLDADGTIGRVERASAINDLVKTTHPVAPVPGMPNNTTQHFDDRLILNSPNTSVASATATAYGLVKGDIAPSTITTAAAKADALIQMRRLDNIFIRLQAAKLASTAINRPIEELMALYRVEGNLGVPPSSLSLDHMIPSDTPTEPSSMPFYPKSGGKHVWPHLVWLAKDIYKYGRDILDVATDGDLYKEPAIIDWALQLCGLDEWQAVYFIRTKSMWDTFIEFSDLLWTRAGLSGSNPAAAAARWDALVSNLVVKQINVNGAIAVSVTPSDPAKFVAGILAEAQAQVLASASISLSESTPPRSSMLYLLFHAHAAGLSVPVLTRALLEVHVTKPAAYTALLNEIEADSDLVLLLDDLKHIRHEADTKKSRTALHGLDNSTIAWVNPQRLGLLTDFFETAGHNVWGSWEEHRGNMSRYMVLLDYYQRLLN